MLELRRLVRRYVNGDIRYSEFRREFVTNFLAVSGDTAPDAAVAEIECLCADVAEKILVSEPELKMKMAEVVRPLDAGSRSGMALVLMDYRVFPSVNIVRASLAGFVSGTEKTPFVASESISASRTPDVFLTEFELTT